MKKLYLMLVLLLSTLLLLGASLGGTSTLFSDTEGPQEVHICAWVSECECSCQGDHTIELLDRDGFSWTYRVVSGSAPSLSHWILAGDCCEAIEAVYENGVEITEGDGYECGCFSERCGPDICGIKFENGYEDGEVRIVTIVLREDTGCVFTEDCVDVVTKAGQETAYCEVCGPVCECGCLGDELPEVTVICPNGGEQWYVYQTVKIEWSVEDDWDDFPMTIDIDFSNNSGVSYDYHIATLQQTSPGVKYYWWSIPYHPYLMGHTSRIRITATDACGTSYDISDEDFCPDLPPEPDVEVISPSSDEECTTVGIWQVRWRASGLRPDRMSIDGFFSADDGLSWTQMFGGERNDGECDWHVPEGFSEIEGRVKIVARYPFGVFGEDESEEIRFDVWDDDDEEETADQAANLVIDEVAAQLTNGGDVALNLEIGNGWDDVVVIDRLVIRWADGDLASRLAEIKDDDGWVSAEIASGDTWDIDDIILFPDDTPRLELLLSDGQPGETLEIEFIMGDGSRTELSLVVKEAVD